MTAEIVKIDTSDPSTAFSRGREVIRAGGVIVYPTETFYGLGADPTNPVAVRRLFEIKGRRGDQPILLLIREAAEVAAWAAEITAPAALLMNTFWPGALTLLFKAKPAVVPELTAGSGAIGLRVPGSPLTRDFLRFLDSALTGTSANLAGAPSPATAEEAARALGDAVDLVLDGGPAAGGKPSTVVDVRTDPPKLVRAGAVIL